MNPTVHELLMLAQASAVARKSDLRPAVELYVAHGSNVNRVIHRTCQRLGHDRRRLIRLLGGPGADRLKWPVPGACEAARTLVDALLDEGFGLPLNVPAYRGYAAREGEAFFVSSCGFVSVTLSKEVAEAYAKEWRRRRGGFAVVIEVPLSKGQPALYVPAIVPSCTDDFELILPPASFHSRKAL